jgi:hypothetical protein
MVAGPARLSSPRKRFQRIGNVTMSLLKVLLALNQESPIKERKNLSPKPSPSSPVAPDVVKLETLERASRKTSPAITAYGSPPQLPVPRGAILHAPRYDGCGKALAAVPQCWCCREAWVLDYLQEYRGQIHVWLKPGCRCLDVAQAVTCCGRCVRHCQCRRANVRTA